MKRIHRHRSDGMKAKSTPAAESPGGEVPPIQVGALARRAQRDDSGSASAGQSGDIQGLSDKAEADSESVEELLEEGQAMEAEAISGVENAPDPDQAEVTTSEVPEDDVPPGRRKNE